MRLIKRPVRITPVTLEYYRARLNEGGWESFWGHANTLAAAEEVCGHDLKPREERPAVTLDEAGYPVLFGQSYRECLVLSPEYRAGYRPSVGKEETPEDIRSWQVLRIEWE